MSLFDNSQDTSQRRRSAVNETSSTHYMSIKLYGDTQRASIMGPLHETAQVIKVMIIFKDITWKSEFVVVNKWD